MSEVTQAKKAERAGPRRRATVLYLARNRLRIAWKSGRVALDCIDVFPQMPRNFWTWPELVLVRFMHRLCAVYRAAVFLSFGLAPIEVPGR